MYLWSACNAKVRPYLFPYIGPYLFPYLGLPLGFRPGPYAALHSNTLLALPTPSRLIPLLSLSAAPITPRLQVTKLCDLDAGDTVTAISWAVKGVLLAIGTNTGKVRVIAPSPYLIPPI